MNAKELRLRAEYIVEQWDNHDVHRLVEGDDVLLNSDGEPDKVTFARHVLATVRDYDDDSVTVEGLVALGGVRTGSGSVLSGWWVDFSEGVSFRFVSDSLNDVMMNHIYWMSDISEALIPRNMKEAREILERCGAIGGVK